MLWAILLTLLVVALYMLPLMPALSELKQPTDDAPLKVMREHDGNFQHFADGFRGYLKKHFSHLLTPHGKESMLDDGTRFCVVGQDGKCPIDVIRPIDKLILSDYSLSLPNDAMYEAEIYSSKDIRVGHGSFVRAALADQNLHLEQETTALRWLHSGAVLKADEACMLYGRASANRAIQLAEDCGFERLQAPRIEFGKVRADLRRHEPSTASLTRVEDIRHTRSEFRGRRLIAGNLTLEPRSLYEGDLITTGAMTIGAGSVIRGSLKSNGYLHIEANVTVEGSVVSAADMYIENACQIFGPVIAEGMVGIAHNCIIGSDDHQTSVTAPSIHFESGTIVHGTVWATEEGRVIGEDELEDRAKV